MDSLTLLREIEAADKEVRQAQRRLDAAIVAANQAGVSNTSIALVMDVSEAAIRMRLKRRRQRKS